MMFRLLHCDKSLDKLRDIPKSAVGTMLYTVKHGSLSLFSEIFLGFCMNINFQDSNPRSPGLEASTAPTEFSSPHLNTIIQQN